MIAGLTAAGLAQSLASKEISCREAALSYLAAIGAHNETLGCFITIDEDALLHQADEAQALIESGAASPLTGVPLAIKDNLSTNGLTTTCGSRMLENYLPEFDATVIERAKAAGMTMLGKTNMDEFGMGTSTENSAFMPTKNPHDVSRSPGGSSGGSAAAVASCLAPIALGSDTGGSVRQPAALCGVVGFKPTYGRCSRYGLVAFGSSLDQVGPIARNVEDAALLAEVISGKDPLDGTTLPLPPISARELRNGSLRGLKVGIPKQMLDDALDPRVRARIEEAIEILGVEGAQVEEISLPSIALGVSTYYIIAPSEASSNLARFDGVRYGMRVDAATAAESMARTRGAGFGHEVKARIMIGTYALSAGYYDALYVRAQQARALMAAEFASAFAQVDVMLSPTSPTTAFKLGEYASDPLAMKRLDYCTIPASLAGIPAISLPARMANGLPVGLQLMAGRTEDEKLLQIAYCVEKALPPATLAAHAP